MARATWSPTRSSIFAACGIGSRNPPSRFLLLPFRLIRRHLNRLLPSRRGASLHVSSRPCPKRALLPIRLLGLSLNPRHHRRASLRDSSLAPSPRRRHPSPAVSRNPLQQRLSRESLERSPRRSRRSPRRLRLPSHNRLRALRSHPGRRGQASSPRCFKRRYRRRRNSRTWAGPFRGRRMRPRGPLFSRPGSLRACSESPTGLPRQWSRLGRPRSPTRQNRRPPTHMKACFRSRRFRLKLNLCR
jgi:hypothetical protein